MNHHQSRRYIFVDFESLKKVKFKKLEKVCDKVFIFVDSKENSLPLELVRQMQRMGRSVKWVVVENLAKSGANYHITFLMGKLHEKVHYDIEFAVLSNDLEFDPLINFINEEGRSCVRVKRKDQKSDDFSITPAERVESSINTDFQPKPSAIEHNIDEGIIDQTAQETINRLIRSGNRPAEVSTLKNYILLHNQELSLSGNLDKIIRKMENQNEIEIQGQEVVYNF
jgi:PIN domain